MKNTLVGIILATALVSSLSASTVLFDGNSAGVNYAYTIAGTGAATDGFYVSSNPSNGPAQATAGLNGTGGFLLSDTYPMSMYSDVGIVLYLDGSLDLGQLQSVDVTTDNPSAININLWLDTGGDGKFFNFGGPSGQYTDLGGDSYGSFGSATQNTHIDGTSTYAFMLGPANLYGPTLSTLEAGYPNAKVALWIGLTNAGGDTVANISSITVDSTPEPGTIWLLGSGFLIFGVGIAKKRRLLN